MRPTRWIFPQVSNTLITTASPFWRLRGPPFNSVLPSGRLPSPSIRTATSCWGARCTVSMFQPIGVCSASDSALNFTRSPEVLLSKYHSGLEAGSSASSHRSCSLCLRIKSAPRTNPTSASSIVTLCVVWNSLPGKPILIHFAATTGNEWLECEFTLIGSVSGRFDQAGTKLSRYSRPIIVISAPES